MKPASRRVTANSPASFSELDLRAKSKARSLSPATTGPLCCGCSRDRMTNHAWVRRRRRDDALRNRLDRDRLAIVLSTPDGWLRRSRCVSVKVDRQSSIDGKALVTAIRFVRAVLNSPAVEGGGLPIGGRSTDAGVAYREPSSSALLTSTQSLLPFFSRIPVPEPS